MENKRERLDYIDALKGFGIILMVLGHMHFGYGNCEKYIFAFHMPLFFLVSGYLYRQPQSLRAGLKKKMTGLLIPYFVFGLGYYFLWLIKNWGQGQDWVTPLKAVLVFSVDGLKGESALWFLMVLFWAWLLYTLLNGMIRDAWIRTAAIFALSALGCLWNGLGLPRLPWGWQDAFAVQGFFLIGQYFRKWEARSELYIRWNALDNARRLCLIGVGLLVNAVLIYKNGMLNIRTGEWPGLAGAYGNALAAVWLYLELIKILSGVGVVDRIVGYVVKRIGGFSIVWLCMNHPAIKVAKMIMGHFPAAGRQSLVWQTGVVLISMGILYVAAEIVMRTPLKVLAGKADSFFAYFGTLRKRIK